MKDKVIKRPEDENDIDQFLNQVELIFQSTYLQDQNRAKQTVKIKWDKEKGLNITNTPMPSRESIEAFLMRMRPIIEYDERLHLGKVITYLIDNADNDNEKEALGKLQTVIHKHQNKRLFAIIVDDKEYGMMDFVWLYLYGKYFHLDKEKQRIIRNFERSFGPLAEVSALTQIEAYAGFAMFVAKYIKDKRSKKGK